MPIQQSPPPSPSATGSYAAALPVIPSSVRSEWAILHAGFVLIGIVTVLLGPLLPALSRHWSLTDAQGGSLIAAQFSGSTLGTALTSFLLPRLGSTRVLCAGFLCFALGFAFLGLGPWYLAAVCVAVYGFAYGLCNPTTNMRATQLPSSNMAGAVSLLNSSWSLGAVLCPLLVGALLPRIGIHGIALCLLAAALGISAIHFSRRTTDAIAQRPPEHRPKRTFASWIACLRTGPFVSLVLLFHLYVGIEAGVGLWVASQERRIPGAVSSALSLGPFFFFGCVLLGRGLAPIALKRVPTARIAIAGLWVIALGILVVLSAQHPVWLYVGAALAGLGCSPQYPIYITWLAQIFRENASWVSAFFFGAAGLGGAVLPWFMGITATQTRSLRLGFLVPLAASLTMVFLAVRARPPAAHLR